VSGPSRRPSGDPAGFAWLVVALSVSFALAGWHFASAGIEKSLRVGLRAHPPSSSVTVYNAWPKGKPYRVVCWLKNKPGQDPVAEMSRRARDAGANGLILMGRDGKPVVRFGLSASQPVESSTAVAVRFLEPAGEKEQNPE